MALIQASEIHSVILRFLIHHLVVRKKQEILTEIEYRSLHLNLQISADAYHRDLRLLSHPESISDVRSVIPK